MGNRLKAILLIFCGLFLLNTGTYAQYRYGVIAGMTAGNYTGRDFSQNNQLKLGFAGALFYEHELNFNLSMVFEPGIEQKGSKYSFIPRPGTSVDVNDKLSYFSIPLLLRINFGRKFNFYINAGIAFQLLMFSTHDVLASESGHEISFIPYMPYDLKNSDAALEFGFGIMFHEMFLDLRYVHGFNSVYKGDNVPDIRNHVLVAKIGVSIFKKRKIPCYRKL